MRPRTFERNETVFTTQAPFPGIVQCQVISPANEMGEIILLVTNVITIGEIGNHRISKMINETVLTKKIDHVFPNVETLFIRIAKNQLKKANE